MNVFDIYSGEYDQWYEKNVFTYLSELEALKCVMPKQGRGLEIGLGTGRFAKPLGVSVGIDPSENMLQIARKRGIETIIGKGESLPFPDKEFDFVLIVITLCFVDNPEQVIAESSRVVKDNGKIIIGIIDKDNHLGKIYQNKKNQKRKFYREANFFSVNEVVELLRRHKFKKINTFQTIFQSLENMKEVEHPKEGFGKGGFVALRGEKI